MQYNNIIERNIKIDDIPTLVLTPKNDTKLHPTIILYHGWGSSLERQRFRAYILCTFGYQVLVPCAIYHGERNSIDHTNPENAGKYFWRIILNNIDEFKLIREYAISRLSADSDRIGVTGNSMGGFTSAGIFTSYKDIKALVVFNGSCNFEYSNEIFMEALNISIKDADQNLRVRIDKCDPIKNLDAIVNRPILLLHGDSDTLVNVNAQREFFKKVAPMYDSSDKLSFIEYPKLNHFVTTNMMEEAAIWFDKYL